jgi:glycine cleavage system H protein
VKKMDISVPEGYYYSNEHEWAKVEGGTARMGITDYAQQKLGDITYVEPPEIGKEVAQFELLTGIESVKAASDIYAPLSGRITAFNDSLEQSPEIINKSPYEDGWIVEIELSDPKEVKNLMNAKGYKEYADGLE